MNPIVPQESAPIRIACGTSFTIALPGHMVEGCEWTLTPSAPIIRQTSTGFGPLDSDETREHLVGYERDDTFTFATALVGSCTLTAELRRTFGDRATVETRRFTVIVEGA